MSNFVFKEIDQEGLETLEAIALADKFNEWMYETIKPFCKGNILEVGSGIGNISTFFIKAKESITLSDIRQSYCDYLRQQFSKEKNCKGVINLDLVHPNFDEVYNEQLATFDTVFALNVVEHIYNDDVAIVNATKLLKKGGFLIILVPAYQFLYNRFDKELEHYRRYTQSSLTKLLATHLRVVHSQYFNFTGILGWFFSGRVLKKKTIPTGQMNLFNKLVPVFKIVDKIFSNKIGLSVIAVGHKG